MLGIIFVVVVRMTAAAGSFLLVWWLLKKLFGERRKEAAFLAALVVATVLPAFVFRVIRAPYYVLPLPFEKLMVIENGVAMPAPYGVWRAVHADDAFAVKDLTGETRCDTRGAVLSQSDNVALSVYVSACATIVDLVKYTEDRARTNLDFAETVVTRALVGLMADPAFQTIQFELGDLDTKSEARTQMQYLVERLYKDAAELGLKIDIDRVVVEKISITL